MYFGLLASRRMKRKMVVLLPLGRMRPLTLMPFDPSVLDVDSEYLLVSPLSLFLLPIRLIFTVYLTAWRGTSFIVRRLRLGPTPSRLPPVALGHKHLWPEGFAEVGTLASPNAITRREWPISASPVKRSQAIGRKFLRKSGVSDSDWFACLHVRELGYYDDSLRMESRCASIEKYGGAIEAITSAGGWVIRVGDPTMTPVPAMPRVLDLAGYEAPDAGRLMAYVTASCRFFICMQSGPLDTAMLFGRPRLITNMYSPVFGLPFLPSDAGVFKYVTSIETHQLLPPVEQLEALEWDGQQGQMSVGGARYRELDEQDLTLATRAFLDYLDSGTDEFQWNDQRSELWLSELRNMLQESPRVTVPLDQLQYWRVRSRVSDHLAYSIIYPNNSSS